MTERISPKRSLKILNTREKKELNQKIDAQWGCSLDRSFIFLLSNKDRLYIADRDVGDIDLEKLKIDNMGLYVCNISDKGIRLTIEGSQMLGPLAKRNVVSITADEVRLWLKGNDIEKEVKDCSGYVMIRHNDDFLGCGKVTMNRVLNFVPKTRRILSD